MSDSGQGGKPQLVSYESRTTLVERRNTESLKDFGNYEMDRVVALIVDNDIGELRRHLQRHPRALTTRTSRDPHDGMLGPRPPWSLEIYPVHTATPLHIACALGREAIAVLLVAEFGADPCAESHGCGRPLHAACLAGCAALVSYLLSFESCRAHVNSPVASYSSTFPLQLAAIACSRDCARHLIAAGANVNEAMLAGGGTTLAAQVLNPVIELAAGPTTAAKLEMVQYLVENGSKVTRELVNLVGSKLGAQGGGGGSTASGEKALAWMLERLEGGIESMDFIGAVRSGNTTLVSLLLAEGCDPNRSDGNWSALHHASRSPGGTAQMTELLLKAGADPHATTRAGKTAAEMADPPLRKLIEDWIENSEPQVQPPSRTQPSPLRRSGPQTTTTTGTGTGALTVSGTGTGTGTGTGAPATNKPPAAQAHLPDLYPSGMQALADMGFIDKAACANALRTTRGDVEAALGLLLQMSD
ncbi:hypothetical protein Pelo_5357 [Pelomyxa schiedti]|nr:hypothetical protein Pelo_5357 [Pelomyxa schiedti]